MRRSFRRLPRRASSASATAFRTTRRGKRSRAPLHRWRSATTLKRGDLALARHDQGATNHRNNQPNHPEPHTTLGKRRTTNDERSSTSRLRDATSRCAHSRRRARRSPVSSPPSAQREMHLRGRFFALAPRASHCVKSSDRSGPTSRTAPRRCSRSWRWSLRTDRCGGRDCACIDIHERRQLLFDCVVLRLTIRPQPRVV